MNFQRKKTKTNKANSETVNKYSKKIQTNLNKVRWKKYKQEVTHSEIPKAEIPTKNKKENQHNFNTGMKNWAVKKKHNMMVWSKMSKRS